MSTPNGPCPRTQGISALLLILAPAALAVSPLQSFAALLPSPWLLSALVALSYLIAGVYNTAQRRWPRVLASLATGLWSTAMVHQHLDSPARGLVVVLGALALLAYVWPNEALREHDRAHADLHPQETLLVASLAATAVGLAEWHLAPEADLIPHLALTVTYLVLVWLTQRRSTLSRPRHLLALTGAALMATLPLVEVLLVVTGMQARVPPIGLLSPLLLLLWIARRPALRWFGLTPTSDESELMEAVLAHPSRILVLSFLVICLFGAAALALPLVSTGAPIPAIDAAFTAVSATCVTGLAVVDTAKDLSLIGQAMVLTLIQVGGLGIMVFSAAAVVLLGKRMSLSHEAAAVDLIGAASRADLVRALKAVLAVTFASEAITAMLLFPAFLREGDAPAVAAWRAIFTAISAFCNAGFALQSESLVPYAQSPFILTVIALTIMISGLGPSVVAAMIAWREPQRRTLHARIVIWSSLLLWVVPTLLLAALEWQNTLRGMVFVDKVSNAFFQAVTLRTAGFNSIDLAAVRPASWTLMILLMFIGGSPGSTAGGVKTTTIAVVVLSILAVVRGRRHVEVFGRTVPHEIVMRATAITTLSVLGTCAALAAIQLTQVVPLDKALFEVVSALATVGLTTGATATLDEIGKVIIIVCMFIGRVGPLTMFVFLSGRADSTFTRSLPEESLPIG